jgi:predicted RNase H-like HicB family nuclease
MAKAMEMHLSAMRQDGDPIPDPSHFELVEAI